MASRSPNELRPDLRHLQGTRSTRSGPHGAAYRLPESGRGAPEALNAAGSGARVVEAVPPPPPARERRGLPTAVSTETAAAAHDLHATRPRAEHENGRCRRGNGAALQGRRILRVRCARAHGTARARGARTDGALHGLCASHAARSAAAARAGAHAVCERARYGGGRRGRGEGAGGGGHS